LIFVIYGDLIYFMFEFFIRKNTNSYENFLWMIRLIDFLFLLFCFCLVLIDTLVF